MTTKTAKKLLRIVAVDDEPDFLSVVRDWLEPRYEFIPLTNGDDLRAELEALEPDLLLLDVRLPGRDGFDLCRELRADSRFDSLPVVFLTADDTDEAFLKNIEVGGTSFLAKPLSRKTLLAAVKEHLRD